ncbi:GntR family transcriptional regulator [Sphingobacterium faecale]|uniref:GntR family transcriptional regulator n=1 Tax=Sphingobacterium faecale TaxID=2803775 RepID=A0ABS1R9G2_9SPHI|nr:GntR family transcriptional regulator [Sphingobacterium faecale]MBL1411179.1 GntR family transcriptional regulator [Sphingobacterium faecale]
MEFKEEKAIYLQIVDFVKEKIRKDEWSADQKILSVRDLASELEVTPNTVMRAYDLLQQQNLVYNKRGLGLFVVPSAKEKITALQKEQFMNIELPRFFNQLEILDISMHEVLAQYNNRTQTTNE